MFGSQISMWYNIATLNFMVWMASSRNVTIIYDQIFHKNLTQVTQQEKNIRLSLIEVNSQYDHLNNITTGFKNISKDDVVLLFTNNDGFFEKNLQNQHLVLKYGLSVANMLENNAKMENAFCLTFNQSLEKALTITTYSLSREKVAIITDEQRCSLQFYSNLNVSISNHPNYNIHTRVHLKHVIYHVNQPQYQQQHQQSLNELTSFNADVIIVLIHHQSIPIFLREVFHYKLISSSALWIIPSYFIDGLSPFTWFPEQILSFQLQEKINNALPYRNLYKSINDLQYIYKVSKEVITSREEIEMYQAIQEIEHKALDLGKMFITFRHRDSSAEKPQHLSTTQGEVDQHQWLYINRNTIPILKPVIEEKPRIVRAVTVIDPPFIFEREDMYIRILQKCTVGIKCEKPIRKNHTVTYKETCCTGFLIDLFILVLQYTGLEASMYIVEDNKYGGIQENGKWNGMIGDVIEGKADMAIAGLTVIKDRATAVDFTVHFQEVQTGIIFRPQVTNLDFINFEFISPLSGNLQIGLWLTVVVTILLHYLYENKNYFQSVLLKQFELNPTYYPLYESISYIGGVTIQRDLGGINPKKMGAKVLAIPFAFAMVVVVTTYTAKLAAESIHHIEKNPFNGTKDERMYNPTPKFRYGTTRSTSYETRFRLSESNRIQRMGSFMEAYNVETAKEGVNKIKNGDLEAFIYDYSTLIWLSQKYKVCEFKVLKETIFPAQNSFALSKTFNWTKQVNNAILYYRGREIISKLQKKWISNNCEDILQTGKVAQLHIYDFGGLIIVLCLTLAAAFLMLIPEHFYAKYAQI